MKILLATDGSEHAVNAAKKCAEIIRVTDETQIKILSVVEMTIPVAADPFGASHEFYLRIKDQSKDAAEDSVEKLSKVLENEFPDGNTVKISTDVQLGSPKEAIVDEAKSWGADLIVVGSHGYGFWERMLLGSVSDAVIHHAPCSVLIVRDSN